MKTKQNQATNTQRIQSHFNFSLLIYAAVAVGLTLLVGLLTLGLGLIVLLPVLLLVGLVLAIAWLVCSIQAAFAAFDGRDFRYPFSLRLL